MAKILFDIVSVHEPSEWMQSHLVMEISHQLFSYVLLDPASKLLHLRFYALDATDRQDRAAELLGVFAADERLTATTAKQSLIYNFPETQLLPELHFNENRATDFLDLLHGDVHDCIVLNERIDGAGQVNVYQVPNEIHALLQAQFAGIKYWHYYTLLLSPGQHKDAGPADVVSVVFYPHRILVSAFKSSQLQLLQSYAYEAAEDVAYHLLNVCRQLQMEPADTPVVLSGMIDASSVLYSEIHKYFGHVSLETFIGACTIPSLEEYPPHFFSPLLKLAICAS